MTTECLLVWLRENKLNKVVLVIKSKDTGETIERWQFDIEAANTEDKSSDELSEKKRDSGR